MGTLYVVATPIGNLDDISKRALDTLGSVDVIFAEDTRVTKKITSNFDLSTRVERYNEHNPEKSLKRAKDILNSDKSIALVSDSGTPVISDPGGKLVRFVREKMDRVDVRVVPGPSALTAALSASGLPGHQFTFLGYPPAKNKRNKFFEKLADTEIRPIILYESKHRLHKTFDNLKEVLGDVEIFVAKEMTKHFEDYFFGSISDAKDYFTGKKQKGEFVIIVP